MSYSDLVCNEPFQKCLEHYKSARKTQQWGFSSVASAFSDFLNIQGSRYQIIFSSHSFFYKTLVELHLLGFFPRF